VVSELFGKGRSASRRFRWPLCGWRCGWVRSAQGLAVDADGDAAMLESVEQGVDEWLIGEQLVQVAEVDHRFLHACAGAIVPI